MEPAALGSALGLFILAFLSRGAVRLKPRLLGSDSWFHLLAADAIRQNRGRYPDTVPKLLLAGPYDYPPLLHYIMAVFPRRIRDRAGGFTGALFDALHTLLVWGVVRAFTGSDGAALAAALLFVGSPLLLRGAERALTLTAKPLSDLWLTFAMLSLYLHFTGHDPLWLGAFTLLTGLMLASHRFGSQALLFLTVGLGIVYRSPMPLAGLGGGFLLALAVTRGHYWKVFKGQVDHLDHWRTYMVDHFIGMRNESFWSEFARVLRDLAKSPARALAIAYRGHAMKYLLYNPWILLVAWALLRPGNLGEDPLFRFAGAWFIATVGLVFLFAVKGLKFLGESENYGEYGVFPMAVLLGMWFAAGPPPAAWLLAGLLASYSVAAIAVNIRAVLRSDQNFDKPETRELLEFLHHSPPLRLIPIPMNWGYAMAYLTPHQVLGWNSNFKFLDQTYGLTKMFEVFPYPDPKQLPEILQRFQIRWLVFWKPAPPASGVVGQVLSHRGYAPNYDFGGYRKVFENAKFVVYDVSPS
ncbi:MAG: hypothetical protein QXT68_06820 [Halobacteria archaeon]